MENNDDLIKAVETIKNRRAAKGTPVTEEEMARKIDISPEQLYAYLEGKAKPPLDLPARLESAYGIGTVIGWSTKAHHAEFTPPKDEAEIRENDRKSLKAIIALIKDRGVRTGQTITEVDMATKAGIPAEQIHAYLNNEDTIPDYFTHTLLSLYQPLLDIVRQEDNRRTLKGMIVKIRNLGLVEGMDITLEEMIRKLDITGEQLYAYLNGEYDLPDNLSATLQTTYKHLVKDSGQVRVKENIYLDKETRTVRLM